MSYAQGPEGEADSHYRHNGDVCNRPSNSSISDDDGDGLVGVGGSPARFGSRCPMSESYVDAEMSSSGSPYADLLGASPCIVDLRSGMRGHLHRVRRLSVDLREPVLRIMDARPVINAKGNALLGKGHEVRCTKDIGLIF